MDQDSPTASPRLLVVDDDPDFLQVLKDALTRVLPSYAVVGAPHAAAALAALRTASFDLIIIDYRLADRDGLALLADLRVEAPALPVIMITGYPTRDLRQQAELLGVSAFLIKPVAILDLRRAVQDALRA